MRCTRIPENGYTSSASAVCLHPTKPLAGPDVIPYFAHRHNLIIVVENHLIDIVRVGRLARSLNRTTLAGMGCVIRADEDCRGSVRVKSLELHRERCAGTNLAETLAPVDILLHCFRVLERITLTTESGS